MSKLERNYRFGRHAIVENVSYRAPVRETSSRASNGFAETRRFWLWRSDWRPGRRTGLSFGGIARMRGTTDDYTEENIRRRYFGGLTQLRNRCRIKDYGTVVNTCGNNRLFRLRWLQRCGLPKFRFF
uniref:Uncharacterized protein n=1 Tax=Sphaerodactylus townsendi TaxID=933632 RepID=A0ACB8G0I7_9SAUR